MHRPPHTWSDVPLARPSSARGREVPVEIGQEGRTYARTGDSGWHMTVCWYAGPGHSVRVPGDPVPERAAADRAIVEEEANSYLADAGIPPRPPGFTWYLEIPPGRTLAGLWQLIDRHERELPGAAPHPRETATAIARAVAVFYA
ncbi:hypothetical protein SRB17_00980 [Streptomyces sp. RB17]|nr:hypothetical protein [Streptomyces sp. RB17]